MFEGAIFFSFSLRSLRAFHALTSFSQIDTLVDAAGFDCDKVVVVVESFGIEGMDVVVGDGDDNDNDDDDDDDDEEEDDDEDGADFCSFCSINLRMLFNNVLGLFV